MAAKDRRVILDRANRMLRQSQTLRKLSEELLEESSDLRASVKSAKGTSAKGRPSKGAVARRER